MVVPQRTVIAPDRIDLQQLCDQKRAGNGRRDRHALKHGPRHHPAQIVVPMRERSWWTLGLGVDVGTAVGVGVGAGAVFDHLSTQV